jgi:hypothetical protein
MNHNWIEQNYPGLVNGNKVLDKYFRCDNCKRIIKIIREDGRIHYLIDDNSLAGKFSQNEPACLKIIK